MEMPPLITDAQWLAELAAIKAEAIGWKRLGDGAYLHHGDLKEDDVVVEVVGVPDAQMAGANVLLLQW